MTAAGPTLERVERASDRERGQASIETVVLLPVMVVVTFAVWQAALAGWTLVGRLWDRSLLGIYPGWLGLELPLKAAIGMP